MAKKKEKEEFPELTPEQSKKFREDIDHTWDDNIYPEISDVRNKLTLYRMFLSGLSSRKIEKMLRDQDEDISYKTIQLWVREGRKVYWSLILNMKEVEIILAKLEKENNIKWRREVPFWKEGSFNKPPRRGGDVGKD